MDGGPIFKFIPLMHSGGLGEVGVKSDNHKKLKNAFKNQKEWIFYSIMDPFLPRTFG